MYHIRKNIIKCKRSSRVEVLSYKRAYSKILLNSEHGG